MGDLADIILYSFLSGVTVFFGGLLRKIENFPESKKKEEFLHSIVAFGGGILVSAVALVLVPKGIKELSLLAIIIIFLGGAVCFFLFDQAISRKGGTKAQLMAMLMDFIPEAIALGAVFAHEKKLGLLLAIFIGLQNLPESFNSFSDLVKSGISENKTLLIFIPLSFCGVVGAILGYLFLGGYPKIIAGLMLFAASGILYLTFQDIAPLAKIEKNWRPALGASVGFLVGIIGQKIIG
ncbi:MAG: divalent cation transporter [Candidatus Omnitrophica bacterium]|nr:divalent cation transporter [Candidatus Omnitrophota bacterium]MCF7891658.1 divalent cation transporter [Candidatus Omnitrophota bacterium]MCF7895709.1 divalent cation transporter [Candidatus Omnitrophota bacterium]MCF7897279.1 divalent cation transporter [Candidatus Omnitrophota bacterium]MCF7909314.1 divalent cation transporter [Candidatus Omnitrophota bacterium]